VDYKFLLDTILKNLDEGIIVVDTKANVTFYNEPVTNIAGIEPERAIGKNILDIFPDLTPETSTFYYVLENKKPLIDYVQSYTNYQGKRVTTETSTLPLIEDGKLVGALEIYRSIDKIEELSQKVVSLQKELYDKEANKDFRGNGTIYTLDSIIGESPAILSLKEKARKVADSDSPILVYGETGTGKELLVQGIHNSSKKRRNKPFIAQNCAAIPRTLLEGILFGTAIGSFTGAKNSPGLFELADGGTLFLDEINSMDIELQAKLLRVLQDGIIRRVGGKNTISVNVRVIASTNEPPLKSIEKGILRKDLYYRLNVVSFNIPPLRERKEDIPLLVNSFISEYNIKLNKNVQGISKEAMDILLKYDWPGNVRELKYTIENIMNFLDGYIIKAESLPSHIFNGVNKGNKVLEKDEFIGIDDLPPLNMAVENYEKKLIVSAIEKANGNCSEAARLLKIPRQTLHNKIKKYQIKWKCTVR